MFDVNLLQSAIQLFFGTFAFVGLLGGFCRLAIKFIYHI